MNIALRNDELLVLGSHQPVDRLLEQAGYTFGIAALEGAALTKLLPANYLTEAKPVVGQLEVGRKDKALIAAESKSATGTQNEIVRQAKEWRRTVSLRAILAGRLGNKMPDRLVKINAARTIPAITGQIEEMTKMLEANLSKMTGDDLAKLLAEGKQICEKLKAVDTVQEIKRLKSLPDAVQKYYLEKGTLYIILKTINDAGRALHANNPGLRARYNMDILNRRAGKRAAPAQPGTAGTGQA